SSFRRRGTCDCSWKVTRTRDPLTSGKTAAGSWHGSQRHPKRSHHEDNVVSVTRVRDIHAAGLRGPELCRTGDLPQRSIARTGRYDSNRIEDSQPERKGAAGELFCTPAYTTARVWSAHSGTHRARGAQETSAQVIAAVAAITRHASSIDS